LSNARPIEDYWAEVNTYDPLGTQRPEHIAVLFKIYIESNPLLEKHKDNLSDLFYSSRSQVYQDIFALLFSNYKRNGYFVDFGATDGISINNTYILEKEYNWRGIVAEPAKVWHSDLYKNRSCNISTDCVWNLTNEKIVFDESSKPEWSAISSYVDKPASMSRGQSSLYEVNTISLNDLLIKFNAPVDIDYLSLDTEGSELDILQAFDFDKYKVKFITCEHNDENGDKGYRQKIYNLLSSKGYNRVWEQLSAWDDWYTLKDNKI